MTWDITITDTNGDTHQPALYAPRGVQLPRRKPQANGRPIFEIGVLPERDSTGDPKWFDAKFEEADITVTFDGTDQPVSTLVGFEDRPAQNLVILRAEGGSELDQRVDVSFGVIETHEAATQVVTNNTSYGTDIPTPPTTVTDDVDVQDKRGGFASSDLQPPPGDDSPVYVTDRGEVTTHQSLFFDSNPGFTALATVGDSISFDFETEYAIPADRVGAGFNTDILTDSNGIEFKVDGEVIGEIRPGADFVQPGGGVGLVGRWVRRANADTRIAPGTHTAVFEVTATTDRAGNTLKAPTPSGLAVYDTTYDYTFDPTLVDGPELYPDAETATFREPLVTQAVTGARIRGFFADNQPGTFTLGNGQASTRVQNSASVDTTFGDRGAEVAVTVELGRYGSDATKTPESGFNPEMLTGYRLFADLEPMPLIVNESFEGTVATVLTELADTLRGDFVWAFDTDAQGDRIIRFVRTGSRSTTENDLENYRLSKAVDRVLDAVTVRGGRVRVDGEGIRLQQLGPVPLDRDRLVEDSETVTDPDTGAVFDRGGDYTIDYDAGTITATTGGAISASERVRVSYAFQPSATVEADAPSTPRRTETVDILPLRSDRGCRLAARQLVDALDTPTFEAEATLRGNVTYPVVEDIAAGRLPTSALNTVDIEATPAGTAVRIEARQSLGDVVGELRERIQSVARHTR